MDAVVFWEFPASRPDEGPQVVTGSPLSLELQRRQRLAEATTAFRGGKIRFAADSATLVSESTPALNIVLAELRRDPQLKLVVKAFTDAQEANGPQLSSNRAQTVVDWLVKRGIARARLEARGCASSRALWVGHTEEQRAANRKAELVRNSNRAGCNPPASFTLDELDRWPALSSQLLCDDLDFADPALHVELDRDRPRRHFRIHPTAVICFSRPSTLMLPMPPDALAEIADARWQPNSRAADTAVDGDLVAPLGLPTQVHVDLTCAQVQFDIPEIETAERQLHVAGPDMRLERQGHRVVQCQLPMVLGLARSPTSWYPA